MTDWCLNLLHIKHSDPQKIVEAVEAFKKGKLLSYFWPPPDFDDPKVTKDVVGLVRQIKGLNKKKYASAQKNIVVELVQLMDQALKRASKIGTSQLREEAEYCYRFRRSGGGSVRLPGTPHIGDPCSPRSARYS